MAESTAELDNQDAAEELVPGAAVNVHNLADRPISEDSEERKPRVPKALDDLRLKYGLPEVFALVVMKQNPRKNKFELVQEFQNFIPDNDYLAEWFGNGEYALHPSYKGPAGKLIKMEPITISLTGAHYQGIFNQAERRRTMEQIAVLGGGAPAAGISGIQQIRETAELLKTIAPTPPPAIDLSPIAEVMRSLVDSQNRRQEPAPINPMVKMFVEAAGAALALALPKIIERVFSKNDKGEEMFDKFINLAEKFGSFKELINPTPPKEDHWIDKIATLLENLAPQFLAMKGTPAEAATVNMIKGTQDYQALKASPEAQKEVVDKFYRNKTYATPADKFKNLQNAIVILRTLEMDIPKDLADEYSAMAQNAG